MADFVTSGLIGVDLTAIYASASAPSPVQLPWTPGQRVSLTNGGAAVFCRAESTIAQFDCVLFSTFADSASATPILRAFPASTALAAAMGFPKVGFAQVAITSAWYGWVHTDGLVRVSLLIGCNPKVMLYTTSTPGALDDTTVSAGLIQGLVANTSATSASAPYCIATYPQLMVQGAG